MMHIVKKVFSTLRFMGVYVVVNTQAAMEYRAAFIAKVVSMALNDCIWLFFWWTYFQRFPLTNGWRVTDIVLLWAITGCGVGIGLAVFGNASQLANLIMNGGLDAYLGMPRYALLHVCISGTDPSAWGDLLFSIGAYIFLLHPDLGHLALFIALSLMGALIFISFLVILCSLAFFLGNTEGLAVQMFNALITFSTYPIDIFHGAVRLMLFIVFPAGFISFIPMQLLHRFTWPLLAAMVGATTLIVLLAVGVFELGLRRYESGNLLGMQG